MKKKFISYYKQYLKKNNFKIGDIIKANIISINNNNVILFSGLKSESYVKLEEFYNNNNININIGDYVDVYLENIENGNGETVLSREKARYKELWLFLEKTFKNSIIIKGIVNGKTKGGFSVNLNGIKAFLPGSLVDVKPVKDFSFLENNEFEFKIIKLDNKNNNVVVSRKAVIEYENNINRNIFLNKIKEGDNIYAIVKNITDYGVFLDLGGFDGLLHITDMSWKKIKHPSDIVNIDDKIKVKILHFNKENSRIYLGLKQLVNDPWNKIEDNYPIGSKISGKITNLVSYGCFVEICDGIEGLVHLSQFDWINKNININKIINIGDYIDVIILNIDKKKRRISLSKKMCTNNPWKEFSNNYNKGDKINGKIKSITNFGIFVNITSNNLDGLIHISDFNNNQNNNLNNYHLLNNYKVGEEIISILTDINIDKERISLSLKLLKIENPIKRFLLLNKLNDIVIGEILSIINDDKYYIIKVKLIDDVYSIFKFSNKNSKIKKIKIHKKFKFNIKKIKNNNIYLTLCKKQ